MGETGEEFYLDEDALSMLSQAGCYLYGVEQPLTLKDSGEYEWRNHTRRLVIRDAYGEEHTFLLDEDFLRDFPRPFKISSEDKIEELERTVEVWRNEAARKDGENKSLKQDLHAAQTEIIRMGKTDSGLVPVIHQMESEMNSLRRLSAQGSSKLGKAERSIFELKAEIATLAQRNVNLSCELRDAHEELDDIELSRKELKKLKKLRKQKLKEEKL